MKYAHDRLGTAPSGRSLRRGYWPLALLVLLTAPAAGQQVLNKPSIGTISPVVPQVRPGAWNEMVGKAINPTDTELTAELVYPTEDPKLGNVRYGRTVWLPPHTESTAWLSIRPGTLNTVTANAKADFSIANETAELMDPKMGRLLDRKADLLFIEARPNAKLFAIVDDPIHILQMPEQIYSYLAQAEAYLYTVSTTSLGGFLPDQWYAYNGVNVLLVGYLDPVFKNRRPSQIQAMLDWVSQGGIVVLFATEKLPEMLAGPLGRAARVSCAGLADVRQLAVRSTDGKFKAGLTLRDPLPYADLIPDGADVMCRSDGLPLMTRARWGQGFFFVLATPLGAMGSTAPDPADPNKEIRPLLGVWQSVGEAMSFAPAIRTEPFTDPMRLEGAKGQGDANLVPDHLGAISGRRGTDRWVVLVWLGAFVLLTAGVGLGMKLIRYGERTWLFMLPVALLMSLAAYIYAESRKADPSLSYVGMALANGDKRAIVYQATGYYSPNEYVTTAYSGSPQGWLLPLVRKANPLEKTELRRAQGVIWPDMTVQRDSAKTFLAAAAIDFDGLDFWAAFGPAGLTGTVVNRTGQDMSDAVLFIHNRAFKIGLVPAEKPTEVKIGPEDRLDEHSFVPAGFKKAEDRWRGELIAGLVEYKSQSSSSLYDDEPYLLGWVDRPVLSPGSDLVAAPCKGLMLVAQRVAFSPTPAGTTVLIPDPMLVKDFKAQALWSRKTGFTRSQYAATVDSLVAPPASVGRLTSTRATMQIALHALGWRLNILGVRPDGSTQPLESFDNPTGPKTIQIEQADNFTADGVLRIRAAVESLNGPAKPAAAAAVNQWKIDFIEFTLQGIVQ